VSWGEGWSKGTSSRIGFRLVPLIAILLWPWTWLAQPFAAGFARACDSVVELFSGDGAQIRFAGPDDPKHPWWILMSVKNVFTGESFEIPVDTRTLAYVRIAVFVALAITWPVWKTRRGVGATALGVAIFAVVMALSVALPLLQVLGIVKVLGLGVLSQSLISIGILTLVSYPSMAYAIPGLIWWLTWRVAAVRTGDAAANVATAP
jgi:hypothetical protein